MQVRLKIGRRAGEIVEAAPDAARAMIADGRATDMRDEINQLPAQAVITEAQLPRVADTVRALRGKRR